MIMGAVLSGCERKDLYLRVDQAEINIAILYVFKLMFTNMA
jgi:hypothetical protein